MQPLVSIVMPCLNAAPWLAAALQSCRNQTYPNVEVIFVDNGSTDGSVEIAKQFQWNRLLVVQCQRKGASAARNEGLRIAHGEFIQFLDADDLLHAQKIEVQIRSLKQTGPKTIAAGAWARFACRPAEAVFRSEPVWQHSSPTEFLITSWLGGGMMPIFAWLTPREVISDAGRWNEALSVNDDGEFFARVVLASRGITFCHDAKGYYRTEAVQSLSRRRDSDSVESEFESVRLSCMHLLSTEDSERTRRACAAAYQRLIYRHYPRRPDLIRKAERVVHRLGGGDLAFPVRWHTRILKSVLGWKAVRRLQIVKRWLGRR